MFAGLCVERKPIFVELFCKRAMYLKGSFAWEPWSCRARLQKKSPGFVITVVFLFSGCLMVPRKQAKEPCLCRLFCKRACQDRAVLQKSPTWAAKGHCFGRHFCNRAFQNRALLNSKTGLFGKRALFWSCSDPTQTYSHTNIHTYTHARTHAHTHTHTHAAEKWLEYSLDLISHRLRLYVHIYIYTHTHSMTSKFIIQYVHSMKSKSIRSICEALETTFKLQICSIIRVFLKSRPFLHLHRALLQQSSARWTSQGRGELFCKRKVKYTWKTTLLKCPDDVYRALLQKSSVHWTSRGHFCKRKEIYK